MITLVITDNCGQVQHHPECGGWAGQWSGRGGGGAGEHSLSQVQTVSCQYHQVSAVQLYYFLYIILIFSGL